MRVRAERRLKISVVVLNWKRPFWLQRMILPRLARHALVDEIVVSHGRADTRFEFASRHCVVVNRDDHELNAVHGLSLRFVAAEQARNEAVLHIDDDLIVSSGAITGLRDRLEAEPNRLHGLIGRGVDASYRCLNERIRDGDVPILLTRCVMTHRSWARAFLDAAPLAAPLLRRGRPLWNGEDIFLSLLSIQRSGLLPRAHRMPFFNIPWIGRTGIRGQAAPPAGTDQLGHFEYREWLTQELVRILGIRAPLDRYLSSIG